MLATGRRIIIGTCAVMAGILGAVASANATPRAALAVVEVMSPGNPEHVDVRDGSFSAEIAIGGTSTTPADQSKLQNLKLGDELAVAVQKAFVAKGLTAYVTGTDPHPWPTASLQLSIDDTRYESRVEGKIGPNLLIRFRLYDGTTRDKLASDTYMYDMYAKTIGRNIIRPPEEFGFEKPEDLQAHPEVMLAAMRKGIDLIATQIVAQGATYVLALKKNHPTLYADVAGAFAVERAEAFAHTPPGTFEHLRTVEKGHGRLEIRQHWVLRDPALLAYLNPTDAWTDLASLGLIERQRHVGGATTTECHYYLLSAPLSAAAFATAARSHWGIENQVHWVLDVTFDEDTCRVRSGHAARNFAVVRHLALNLLRQNTRKGSIATKRFTAALDDTYLATILAGVAQIPQPVT